MVKIVIKGIVALTVILIFSVSYAADTHHEHADSNHEQASHKHHAVLNLNTATQADIAKVINAIAQIDLCHEITKYREAHNGFKSIEELKSLHGVTEELYKKITENVTLEI